jgi:predicted dehydrogenase
MYKKKFCIVGYGNHSKNKILPAIKKINGKIEGVVSKKNIIDNELNFFISLDDALLNVHNETIFILCSPPDVHLEQAIKIIGQGHNLFIEKPITTTYQDLSKIIEAANNKKIFFVENFMHEYSSFYNNFLNFWHNEKDSINKININFIIPKLPSNTFRENNNTYPVNLFDIGCYIVSLINNLSNKTILKLKKISNKGITSKELYTIVGKVNNSDVEILFGIDSYYDNHVKMTNHEGIEYKYTPFFYGRKGSRLVQKIKGDIIDNYETYEEDCFTILFQKDHNYWRDTQNDRNILMLKNLSLLENLNKQYNDI